MLVLTAVSVGHAQTITQNSSNDGGTLAPLEIAVNNACIINAHAGMLSLSWFGTDGRDRILTVEEAAARRSRALVGGYDPIELEEERYQRVLSNLSNSSSQSAVADVSCLKNYLALLNALDAPSRALMQQQQAQAIAAKNAQQVQQTQQQIQVQQDQAAEAAQQKIAADQLAAQQDALKLQAANAALEAQQKDMQIGISEAHLLPACDSDHVLKYLQAALFLGGLTVQSLDHATDSSTHPFGGTAAEPERFCNAHFLTADHDGEVSFGIVWVSESHQDIDIKILNEPS
jgi:hypothetical protein